MTERGCKAPLNAVRREPLPERQGKEKDNTLKRGCVHVGQGDL